MYKQFSEEEKATYKEEQKAAKIAVFEKLELGVRSAYETDKYKNCLKVMSKFHNYSISNSMLIAIQNPQATLCAGLTTWNKNGRSVNKGEQGLVILAPVLMKSDKDDNDNVLVRFKLTKTFDVSQTNGKELPSLCDELTGTVEQKDKIIKALEKVTGIKLEFGETDPNVKGYFSATNNKIMLKSGMSELQTIKTAIHETAHAILHKKGGEEENATIKASEIQAESVAFVVSNALRLDTSDYSFNYVAGWSNDKSLKDLKSNFEIIQKTSDKIITAVNKEIKLTRSVADLEKPISFTNKKSTEIINQKGKSR